MLYEKKLKCYIRRNWNILEEIEMLYKKKLKCYSLLFRWERKWRRRIQGTKWPIRERRGGVKRWCRPITKGRTFRRGRRGGKWGDGKCLVGEDGMRLGYKVSTCVADIFSHMSCCNKFDFLILFICYKECILSLRILLIFINLVIC